MARQTHSSSPAHSTAACSLGTPSINLSKALPTGPAERTSDPTKNRVAALLVATSSADRPLAHPRVAEPIPGCQERTAPRRPAGRRPPQHARG